MLHASLPDALANDAVLQRYMQRMQSDPASLAFVAVADVLIAHGFAGDAVQMCVTGLAQHPFLLAPKLTLARAHTQLGDVAAARKILDDVLQEFPEHVQAKQLLAELQKMSGGEVRGAPTPPVSTVAAKTANAKPSPTPPRVTPASATIATTSTPHTAIEASHTTAESPTPPREKSAKPATPLFYTLTMARLYAAQGFRADAIAIYERVMTQEPENAVARKELAELRAAPLSGASAVTSELDA